MRKNGLLYIVLSALLLLPCIAYAQSMADYTCNPIFTANTVKPNILILMDNSANMNLMSFGYDKDGYYHPGNWRKIMDYGCGTLGDMGVHIFDTPYNALKLDVPKTIVNECRQPTGFGFPEKNIVSYTFPGTEYTTKKFKWVWYDGEEAPEPHKDL